MYLHEPRGMAHTLVSATKDVTAALPPEQTSSCTNPVYHQSRGIDGPSAGTDGRIDAAKAPPEQSSCTNPIYRGVEGLLPVDDPSDIRMQTLNPMYAIAQPVVSLIPKPPPLPPPPVKRPSVLAERKLSEIHPAELIIGTPPRGRHSQVPYRVDEKPRDAVERRAAAVARWKHALFMLQYGVRVTCIRRPSLEEDHGVRFQSALCSVMSKLSPHQARSFKSLR